MARIFSLSFVTFVFFHSLAFAVSSDDSVISDALRFTVLVKTRVFIGLGGDRKTTETRPYLGTGMVIDTKKGYVLTSRHVVTKSPADIHVIFHNKEKVPAKRIYLDSQMDLAVLQVDPKAVKFNWKQAGFQESSSVRPGHPVLAFGHPLGYEFSASRGIISSSIRKEVGYGRFYQSDTVIGGGNSGGPLISLRSGHVLGMNTYRTTSEGTQLTFSLLADDFIPILNEIRTKGKVERTKRGEVGINFTKVDDKRLKWYLKGVPRPKGLYSQGMFVVASVRPNGPGDRAGIQPYDLIYQVGPVVMMENTIDKANRYVDEHVGQDAPIKIVRQGQLIEKSLFIEDADQYVIKEYVLVTGVAVHNLTSESPGFNLFEQVGVEVGDIMDDAPGDRGTLRRFDIIKEVNGIKIKDIQDFLKAVEQVPEGSKVEVRFQRFSREFDVDYGLSQLEIIKPRRLGIEDPMPVD